MYKHSKILSFLLLIIFFQGKCYSENTLDYDLTKSKAKFVLPNILFEISDIAYLEDNEIACVQDEKGIVFIYDFSAKKIVDRIKFNYKGDYEGIAVAGNNIYILRSDAFIYEIVDYKSKNPVVKSYKADIPALNNEGLCYDPEGNRLLIACKSNFLDKKEAKSKRYIYSFDLKTKKVSKSPVFEILISDIEKFLAKKDLSLPQKTKKDGTKKKRRINFRPSAIAINPISKNLYILSASEQMLYVFDLKGKLLHIEILDRHVFKKAEGICFDSNNNLFISNEGVDTKPTLLMFEKK